MKAKQYKDTFKLARDFAASDKSDPFVFNRVMSHINNGICDDHFTPNGEPIDSRYKAFPDRETRKLPDCGISRGAEYTVTVYKNVQRP